MGEKTKRDMGETRTPAGIEKSEQNCTGVSNERKHLLELSVCVCVCVCVCVSVCLSVREDNALESSTKVT